MPYRDLACAALGWAIAATTWIAASRLQRSLLSDEFGADGLPRGLALLLAATSTLIALRAAWALYRGASPAPASEAHVPWRDHAKAFGIVALGFLYVLLAPWTGYVPAAAVLLAAATVYYGARPSVKLAAISLAGAVFLWWMFAKMLNISMPAGSWAKLFT